LHDLISQNRSRNAPKIGLLFYVIIPCFDQTGCFLDYYDLDIWITDDFPSCKSAGWRGIYILFSEFIWFLWM